MNEYLDMLDLFFLFQNKTSSFVRFCSRRIQISFDSFRPNVFQGWLDSLMASLVVLLNRLLLHREGNERK